MRVGRPATRSGSLPRARAPTARCTRWRTSACARGASSRGPRRRERQVCPESCHVPHGLVGLARTRCEPFLLDDPLLGCQALSDEERGLVQGTVPHFALSRGGLADPVLLAVA